MAMRMGSKLLLHYCIDGSTGCESVALMVAYFRCGQKNRVLQQPPKTPRGDRRNYNGTVHTQSTVLSKHTRGL